MWNNGWNGTPRALQGASYGVASYGQQYGGGGGNGAQYGGWNMSPNRWHSQRGRGNYRGGGRGTGGRARNPKRSAPGAASPAAKRAAPNTPGLSACNMVLLSGYPSPETDHEAMSTTQFSNINNTLRVGRFDYALSVTCVTSDATAAGNKIEFEVPVDDLAYFHLSEVEQPAAPAIDEAKTSDAGGDGDDEAAATAMTDEDETTATAGDATDEGKTSTATKKDGRRGAHNKKKEPVVARAVFVVKNPVKITKECEKLISTENLKNARVFIFEFRGCRASLKHVPKDVIKKALTEGPLVEFNDATVWPESGERSMAQVVERFVDSVHQQVKHITEVIPCPQECGQEKARRNMDRHVKSDCPKRESKCSCCQAVMCAGDVATHQKDECGDFPQKCKFGCGVTVLRKDREGHLPVCKRVPVSCRYENYGCVTPVCQSQLQHHYTSQASAHLALVEQKFASFQETAQAKIDEFEAKLAGL